MVVDPRLPQGRTLPRAPARDQAPRAERRPERDPAVSPRVSLGLGTGDGAPSSGHAGARGSGLLASAGLKWSPRAGAPAHGGLHQLTLATVGLPSKDGPKLDFSTYRLGYNNRGLLGAIARDLEGLMGVKLPYAFGQDLEAVSKKRGPGLGFTPLQSGGYRIGENMIDALLSGVAGPRDRHAIAAFAIAHEFFHAYLDHAETAESASQAPKGFRVKQSERFRKVAELQVDYLAAKYLMLRGLPTEAILKMFEEGDFPASDDYPSGKERADNVRRALEPGFALELFQNDVLDCLAFLDFLAGGPTP